MKLSTMEQEKLIILTAADVARRRRERGLKLNYPEAVAIISAELLEGARDGRSVADLMASAPRSSPARTSWRGSRRWRGTSPWRPPSRMAPSSLPSKIPSSGG